MKTIEKSLELEIRLNYMFKDKNLLRQALTHRSFAHENANDAFADNESLEFLGDAVIGFIVADLLCREFPNYNEGEKSKIKALLVSSASLAGLGERLSLGGHLFLGVGEEKTGGREKLGLIADTYEALVAAIYLDSDIEVVRKFLENQFNEVIETIRETNLTDLSSDYKSTLQEWLQSRDLPLPEYRIRDESGPDHRKLFKVEVLLRDQVIERAEGLSKKEAEQNCAKRALERFKRKEVTR